MSSFPLHVKRVPVIKIDAVRALPMPAHTLARLEHALGWLNDIDRYAKVPRRTSAGMPTARVTPAVVATLQEYDVVAEIDPSEVASWTQVFTTVEYAKKRLRPIKHTFLANEALGKETLMETRFPTKSEITDLVNAGEYFIAFDFSAYFDQFEYSRDVSRLFCFASNGKAYRLRKLAMGQRQAVEVAAAVTDALRGFPGARARSLTVIDNVIFAGSREDVLHDAAIFIERVRTAGALLNEDASDLEKLLQTSGDWCGVHLDMTAKTVSLTQKCLDKLLSSWERRHSWTWRNFAAHVGLLFWSWGILDAPIADYFPLLRFMSASSRLLQARPDLWDKPAWIWPSVVPTITEWHRVACANAPRAVAVHTPPEWLVCTDASAWGWGYVALNTGTGVTYRHGAPWDVATRMRHGLRLGHSAFAEPKAILNSLCHLLSTREGMPRHVRIGTDSTVARASFQRGFNSHSWDINECLREWRRIFGTHFELSVEHIPGKQNPADALSRGAAETEEQVAATEQSLRRLLGSESVRGVGPTLPQVTAAADNES